MRPPMQRVQYTTFHHGRQPCGTAALGLLVQRSARRIFRGEGHGRHLWHADVPGEIDTEPALRVDAPALFLPLALHAQARLANGGLPTLGARPPRRTALPAKPSWHCASVSLSRCHSVRPPLVARRTRLLRHPLAFSGDRRPFQATSPQYRQAGAAGVASAP